MGTLKLGFFDKLILLIALLLALGMAMGFFAGNFDPRQHILFAFFGLAYPFFLLANIIMAFYWLIRRKWAFMLLTFTIIAFGWRALVATYGFGGEAGASEKDSAHFLRLMTYNVHQFKPYGYQNDLSTKNEIIEVIKKQHPDVVCFQEFYTRYKGKFDIVDSIKKSLKLKYFYFVPSVKNDYEAIGLAIFSKYPIKNKGSIVFNGAVRGNESIYADIEIEKQLLRIYNVHFQSISFQKEDYQYVEKVKEMKTDLKPSRRIAGMLKYAFQKRAEQVDIMKDNLETCTIPYVICGDFNDTPASYTVTQITKSLNNAFIKQGSGLGKTYNGKFPNFQIDYIATTKKIDVINYHIIEAKLSDHFPVRSDLKLNYSSEGKSE
jgi:endonuclease/exonuclease/phosphatase family metal-dependent hydrolase